jgi:mRNA interferase RelE/StbE
MKTLFRDSFWRDVMKKVKDKKTIIRIDEIIEEAAAAENISGIKNVKKMEGADDAYRIRVGNFRIGVFVEGDVIEFVRCLPRKDIYKFFP